MTVQDYVRALRRNLVIIISILIIGLSAGILVALSTPTRYTASVELFVSPQTAGAASTSELNLARSYAQQATSSYASLIPSSIVLQPVIDDLGLDTTVSSLGSRVEVTTSPASTAMTVSVANGNPGQAARIANAIGDSFTRIVATQLERPVGTQASIVRIDTLEAAQVPLTPSAPNVPLIITLGALVGLGIGVLAAAVRSLLDDRIRSVEDVEIATGLPILGGIALDPNASKNPLIIAASAHDHRAEAFRSLRTNVKFLAVGGAPTAFVITSSGPGEGKSTTATNLAIAFADSGAKVALIDADLRLPRIADYLSIEGSIGLTEVLIGRLPASEAMQRWGRGALFVLPSGTVPPNPAELLGSAGFENLLNELKSAFDIVIIDAPPVGLVTDAAVIARRTDGAILVAAAGKTHTARLKDAVTSIESIDARVAGAVVTMLPTKGADRTTYGAYGNYGMATTGR